MSGHASGPGRKPKTSAFTFRAKAYYYAIVEEAKSELGRPVNYRDLNGLFASHVDGPEAKIWYTYKAGESLPGRGTQKQENSDLAGAIEARWPRAVQWRDHPFWTLIDRVNLTEENIHALILRLSDATKTMLVGSLSSGHYCRWFSNPEFEAEALCTRGTFDDLAALVALVREAEIRQELFRYEPAKAGMTKMLDVLNRVGVTKPFARELSTYMLDTFTHMWTIVPGLYCNRPASL